MVELFLSTDGKHTVHVGTGSMEEANRLLPEALRIYEAVVAALGTKPALWEPVMNGKRAASGNGHDGSNGNGQSADVPRCKIHETDMVLQKGRYGRFWSCRQKNEFGRWCSYTVQA